MVSKIVFGGNALKKQMTIYEVAKKSGVSVTTVSRVLNDSPLVSEKTRQKVLDVVKANQYSPNAIARAMTSKQTRTIGVILPDITNPYFSALFMEIERFTTMYEYSTVLCNTMYVGSSLQQDGNGSDVIAESKYIEMLLEKRVEGIIIIGGRLDCEAVPPEYISMLNDLNRRIPVVLIAQTVPGCECRFLNLNLGGGVSLLVQHLVALGNRRIGFVGGEVGVRQTSERLKAYRETMQSLNMEIDDELVALTDYYPQDGYKAMQQMLLRSRPDAVIAINDRVALGAIRAIKDADLQVPEDIAVVSCDKFADSDYYVPRLTTLEQQPEYVGRLAILMLMSAISGTGDSVYIDHNPQMVVRESCGAKLGARRK